MDNLLEEYGKVLNIPNLTIETLIKSHKFLRSEYLKSYPEKVEEIKRGVELGIKYKLDTDYIKKSDFIDRTFRDICNEFYDE